MENCQIDLRMIGHTLMLRIYTPFVVLAAPPVVPLLIRRNSLRKDTKSNPLAPSPPIRLAGLTRADA